jgi:hypothetical protein
VGDQGRSLANAITKNSGNYSDEILKGYGLDEEEIKKIRAAEWEAENKID